MNWINHCYEVLARTSTDSIHHMMYLLCYKTPTHLSKYHTEQQNQQANKETAVTSTQTADPTVDITTTIAFTVIIVLLATGKAIPNIPQHFKIQEGLLCG
jgi:hypothetical protein